MSASRDKSQKVTFVYSNLYQLYRKGKETAQAADPEAVIAKYKAQEPAAAASAVNGAHGLSSGKVIKVEDLNQPSQARMAAEPPVAVRHYEPVELLAKRLPKPESISTLASVSPHPVQNQALNSLKQNLNELQNLHSRLRFMLQELEELVKE